ncbi:MAG: hypothetical protein ACQCN6_07050 [Candidatus Bathyarchaeia archaeon]
MAGMRDKLIHGYFRCPIGCCLEDS